MNAVYLKEDPAPDAIHTAIHCTEAVDGMHHLFIAIRGRLDAGDHYWVFGSFYRTMGHLDLVRSLPHFDFIRTGCYFLLEFVLSNLDGPAGSRTVSADIEKQFAASLINPVR
jgi:hypothetical protein